MDSFSEWLVEHGGNPDGIIVADYDMSPAYRSGIRRNFRNIRIVFDRFHMIKLVTDAFDKCRRCIVRKEECRDGTRFLSFKHERI